MTEIALDAIGTPHKWGGTDANKFDCSGLVQFAYDRVGISLPRVRTAQMRAGGPISLNPDLFRAGDILGLSTTEPDKTSHLGLYVGDGEFIHSNSSGVRISSMQNVYWQDHIKAARRIVYSTLPGAVGAVRTGSLPPGDSCDSAIGLLFTAQGA